MNFTIHNIILREIIKCKFNVSIKTFLFHGTPEWSLYYPGDLGMLIDTHACM